MRWTGCFQTPNVAGLEMGLLLVIAVPLMVSVRSNLDGWKRAVALSILGLIACLALFGLIASGSRAAAVAVVVAFVLLGVLSHVYRRIAIGVVALVVLLVAFSPHSSRYTNISQDSSRSDRVQLWHSTLAIIADHPVTGVPHTEFPQILDRWYLPSDLNGRFSTALNDTLTATVWYGIPVVAIGLGLLTFVIYVGCLGLRRGALIPTIGLVMVVVHFIAGCFQAHLFTGWWNIGIGWGLGIAACLYAIKSGINLRGAAVAIASCLVCAAFLSLLALSVEKPLVKTRYIENSLMAHNRSQLIQGIAVVVPPPDISHADFSKWSTGVIGKNWGVIALHEVPADSLLQEIEGLYQDKVVVIGHGNIGTNLWELYNIDFFHFGRIFVTDPERIPSIPTNTSSHSASLIVQAAKLSPFIDVDAIQSAIDTTHRATLRLVPGSNGAWWKRWPTDLLP